MYEIESVFLNHAVFTCRPYQTDFTVSALATDNRSFILFTACFNLTPTFSSQQSEVTTAVVFSYKIITSHLPPLGVTANVELFSITDLTLCCDFPLPRSKR